MKNLIAAAVLSLSSLTALAGESVKDLEDDYEQLCLYVNAGSEIIMKERQNGKTAAQSIEMIGDVDSPTFYRQLVRSIEIAYKLPLDFPPRYFSFLRHTDCLKDLGVSIE